MDRIAHRGWFAVFWAMGLAACAQDADDAEGAVDGSPSPDLPRAADEGGLMDSAPDAGSAPDAVGWPQSGVFPCPASAPARGASCDDGSAVCGYDPVDPTSLCQDVFDCDGGIWVLRPPERNCELATEVDCPARPPADGTPCAATWLTCPYPGRMCICGLPSREDVNFACVEDTPEAWRWFCVSPDPGCPTRRPRGACQSEGRLVCRGYETCFPCGPYNEAATAVCDPRYGVWEFGGSSSHEDCAGG